MRRYHYGPMKFMVTQKRLEIQYVKKGMCLNIGNTAPPIAVLGGIDGNSDQFFPDGLADFSHFPRQSCVLFRCGVAQAGCVELLAQTACLEWTS